jgi:hypothetical protein
MFGSTLLGYLAIRVYQDHVPIAGRVVTKEGKVVSRERTFSAARKRS